MYAIPKDKRKVTPRVALQILEKEGVKITLEEVEIVLDIMYNFAKLALNQQLQIRPEGQDQLISFPEPG